MMPLLIKNKLIKKTCHNLYGNLKVKCLHFKKVNFPLIENLLFMYKKILISSDEELEVFEGIVNEH